MPNRPSQRICVSLVALATALQAGGARAGDLNAEVNTMFNNLGTIGNYTAPGAFRGQTFNTYTGGSLFMRAPNKVYQLAAIQFPSAKAGCGGIDVFGGSFSHISAAEFKKPAPTWPSRWAWRVTATQRAAAARQTAPASWLRPARQATPTCATRRPSSAT